METTLIEDEIRSPLVPDPTIPGKSSRHLHSLDGLRGVAILLVLLFHGFLTLQWTSPWTQHVAAIFGVGWMGVDIFFVLSGFLITGILLDSKGSAHFFRNFYGRRVLRIVPVYYLLLAIIFIILPNFVSFDTEGLQIIRRNQGWLWLHVTNWGYIWRRKAFTNSGWLNLDHLWSLAVEEQFYLCWPLMVFLLSRGRLKILCYVCIAGSFLLRAALWARHMRNGALYFPTPCRLDGLAMGALVAILFRQDGGFAPLIKNARNIALGAIAALAALIIWRHGFIFTDSANIVFGVLFIGVLSASVIVLIAEPANGGILAKVMLFRPLRTLGKYAYGLYLFHSVLREPLNRWVPAGTLVRITGSEVIGNFTFVAMFCVVSFCAAFISWHVYEKQWLKLKRHFDYKPPAGVAA